MQLRFFFFFSFLSYSECITKLTVEENELLQETCGIEPVTRRGIINGSPIQPGHKFGYAVGVYFTFQSGNKSVYVNAAGTIISSRHIVFQNPIQVIEDTFKFNGGEVVEKNGSCTGNHYVLHPDYNSRFDFTFGIDKDSKPSFPSQKSISNVVVINGCVDMKMEKLMVLELEKAIIPHEFARPACILRSSGYWSETEKFTVYGVDDNFIYHSVQYKPSVANCEGDGPFSCAVAVNKTQKLCRGDSGGTAMSKVNSRDAFFGLFVVGNVDCAFEGNNTFSKFVNAGFYAEAFCDAIGICVNATSSTSSTTTPISPTISPTTTSVVEATTFPSEITPIGQNGEVITVQNIPPIPINQEMAAKIDSKGKVININVIFNLA